MRKMIDARGKPCPQPVVLLHKGLAAPDVRELLVLVSTLAQAENVARAARNRGCSVSLKREDDFYAVEVKKVTEETPDTVAGTSGNVVFVRADTIGRGDDNLGQILIKSFLPTLAEVAGKPRTLIFMNSGVKLTVEGSPVLDALRQLEQAGIELLVCGTCLDYFNLKEKVAVGKVSNMFEITERLLGAKSVVSL